MDWFGDLPKLALVMLAGILGAVVGMEREISDKPAGLRTHIFVCAGAALLMLLGDAIVESFRNEGDRVVSADPIRVLQALVIGISFLGAGTVIHPSGDRVEGLTTAASIFLTAGVGVAVAVRHMVLAIGTTLFMIIVLSLIGWIEHRLWRKVKEKRKNAKQTERSAT